MSSQQSVDGNPPPTKKLKPDAGTTGDTPPFTTVTMATPATLISTNVTSTNNLQQGSVISVTFSNVYDNYQYYYGTSPPSYFYADDCDCNKGDCPPGTTYQGSCGDDMNYCC
uniref:Uncharacterized protein n=1 Tax=Magallana gigas TaxID=29159 RepID=K1RA81_MAGGI